MTIKEETAVRDAAKALSSAIYGARAAGLAVIWPRRFEDLSVIAISATAKAKVTEAAKPPASAPKASDKA